MLAAAAAIAASLVCVVAARRRYRRLTDFARPSLSGRSDDRLHGLLPGAEAARGIDAVLDAPTRAHGVAELNDLLREIQHELDRGRGTAAATARIALFVGWLAAAVEILASQTPAGALAAGVGITAGVGGGMACWTLGRRADQQAAELRAHWNRVAGRLERQLGSRPTTQDDQSVDRARNRR